MYSYVHMYVCIAMYVCMYSYVCMYVCMYVCIAMYVCMFIVTYFRAGKHYDELQAREQRRRKLQIKSHVLDWTSPLEDIGLEAASMQLITTNGNTVDIQLKD